MRSTVFRAVISRRRRKTTLVIQEGRDRIEHTALIIRRSLLVMTNKDHGRRWQWRIMT
jgi:hypothetical protein